MKIKQHKKTALKKGGEPSSRNKNDIELTDSPDKTHERMIAEIALSPIVSSINTARAYSCGIFGETDLTESIGVMRDKTIKIQRNDLSDIEETLIGQVDALNMMFNELARRAAMNMGEHLTATEAYLRLALKAQAQCRATIQALSEIKSPRAVAYVKQANIANGPQQVNNGIKAED